MSSLIWLLSTPPPAPRPPSSLEIPATAFATFVARILKVFFILSFFFSSSLF
jgi:hypothetical protein